MPNWYDFRGPLRPLCLQSGIILWSAVILRMSRQLMWVSVRASLHMGRAALSIYLSVCPSVYLFVCPPNYSFSCLSVHMFAYLSGHIFIHLCISVYIHPSIILAIHLTTVYLCVYLSFHISISHLILQKICSRLQKTHTIIKNKQTHTHTED